MLPINGRETRWARHDLGDDGDPAYERALAEAYEHYAAEVEALLAARRRSTND